MSDQPVACYERDKNLIDYRLKEHDEVLEQIREEQIKTRIYMGVNHARAAIYGAVGGAIVSALIALLAAWLVRR